MNDFQKVNYTPRDEAGNATGPRFFLHLPQHTVYQKMHLSVMHQNENAASMLPREAAMRPVDDPIHGRVFIWQRDEREVKEGKPLGVYDDTGPMPLFIAANGMHRWEELDEWMAEEVHYAKPAYNQLRSLYDMPNLQESFWTFVEQSQDLIKGRSRSYRVRSRSRKDAINASS